MVSSRTPSGPATRVARDTRAREHRTAPAASRLRYLARDRHPDLSPYSEKRMRTLPAVLVAAHAVLIGFACHEIVAPKPVARHSAARAGSASCN